MTSLPASRVTYSAADPSKWPDQSACVDVALDTLASSAAEILTFFNGTFVESFDALVTSDGTTVTMSLEQSGGGDLTMTFSDGKTVLDCTPAQTIALTAGTDTAPVGNHVYVLQSTKALTVSTSDWPSAEHIRVGYFFVPSATFVQNDGVYINQNWNDHRAGTDNQGHLAHMGARIRADFARYRSGIDGDGTTEYVTITTNGGSPDNVTIQSTSGSIFQMHEQAYPAKDTSSGDSFLVTNDNTTPYDEGTDLNAYLTDAEGGSMTGRYYNLVLGGVGNKGGEYGPLLINLPTGSYSNQSDAEADVEGYTVTTFPSAFTVDSSTAFPIAIITLRHQNASGGTWTHIQTTDLRGTLPGSSGGGGGGGFLPLSGGTLTGPLSVDTITETTPSNGVSVDGITISDIVLPIDIHGFNDNTNWNNTTTDYYLDYGRTAGAPAVLDEGKCLVGLRYNCRLLGISHTARLVGLTASQQFDLEIMKLTGTTKSALHTETYTMPTVPPISGFYKFQTTFTWADNHAFAAGDFVGIKCPASSRTGTWNASNLIDEHAIILHLGVLISDMVTA